MIREVDLTSYLPPFVRKYKEPAAALAAETPEFEHIWDAVNRIFYNRFISTADEYGISRFERMMKIVSPDRDNLETRRMRVQNRWLNSVPYTIRALAYKVAELLGGEYHFSIFSDFDAYGIQLVVYSANDSMTEELKYLLSVMLPINIAAEIIYEAVTDEVPICFGGVMEQADIVELRQR